MRYILGNKKTIVKNLDHTQWVCIIAIKLDITNK